MKTTRNTTQDRLSALLAALTLVTLLAVAVPCATAEGNELQPPLTLSALAGSWQATLFGDADCGIGTQILVFTLNSSGTATDVQYIYHTARCGNGTDTNQSFTITSLNLDGSGTAQLEVKGTTTTYNIQVNQAATIFNLVDVTDSGQYHQGTALKQ